MPLRTAGPPASEKVATAPLIVEIRHMLSGGDAAAFRALNEEWIVRHFTLEARDVEMLGNPDKLILQKGGYIFIAHAANEVVGCAALIPLDGGVYELSKMAVAPHLRGRGLGRRMLLHAVAYAKSIGAKSLFLGSSTKLPAAVCLYESVGFRHIPIEQLPPMSYTRADVFMAMQL